MKMKRIKHHNFDNSEASERLYQQKLKADQNTFQTFLNSFSQCICVPFYPYFYLYDYLIFTRTNSFVDQPEDNKNKEYLKKKNK
ncbi:hypothetical protein [Anaerocolumna sp. MB42-C2]|uniref:hypothetical protein n=1 Tax=Anaerocolumna sp. MB42-C2 TaxID=3070997 RepID=UPI0027E0A106|nr:hypothetical protein [Anaerocolumna sp. MB42-C2]WMJ87402.1 hypothetical protein RBU59_25750 [Anaerocolumna sp. MB42-C2]